MCLVALVSRDDKGSVRLREHPSRRGRGIERPITFRAEPRNLAFAVIPKISEPFAEERP